MIRVENLTRRFDDLTAVDHLNFEIRENEIFGLLGPNGAGKTTTINLICGLLPPTSGNISFDILHGTDRKTLIGYCPQENIFYPKLTCMEQMIFTGRMYGVPADKLRSRSVELIGIMGLKEKSDKLASGLSGGMKRRLNICLALVHDPPILVLDEPEAGLDPQSRLLVRNFLKAAGREKTVILTTHNMDEADRMSDRVAIMDHGKLLRTDTPRNLKKTVGEGDVLELAIEKENETGVREFSRKISGLGIDCRAGDGVMILRHLNIIGFLPEIKTKAESSGLTISEIRLRENTLEDVFIHLTGRKLRE